MKRILITLSALLLVSSLVHAQRITVSFRDTPLAQALTQIGKLQHEYDIVAIHDDLTRYTATADIVDATVPEAVSQLIECYPLRMTVGDGRVVYVEAPYRDYVHYRGTVLDRDGHPLPYVNVTLYHPVDTTLQAQAPSSNSGLFVIPSRQENALLRFTHIAHDTLWLHADTPDLGTIQLRPRLQPLDTVSIQPAQANRHSTVRITKAGSLVSLLTPEQQDTITSLVIEGPINSADIRLLRRMAGYREREGDKAGKLRTLDLRKARITSDKEPYLVLDAGKEGLVVHAMYQDFFGAGAATETKVTHSPQGGGRTTYSLSGQGVIRYVLGDEATALSGEPESLWGPNSLSLRLTPELTDEQIRAIRRKSMKKTVGHRLVVKDRKAMLECSMKKNIFAYTMFYGCTSLEDVAIPTRSSINRNVIVQLKPMHYYQLHKKK